MQYSRCSCALPLPACDSNATRTSADKRSTETPEEFAFSRHFLRTFAPSRPSREYTDVDYDTAIARSTEAIGTAPDFAAHYDRALAYAHKGDYDRAIADFTRAVEIAYVVGEGNADKTPCPVFPAHCERGKAYARKGDYVRAAADFREAIEGVRALAKAEGLQTLAKPDGTAVFVPEHLARNYNMRIARYRQSLAKAEESRPVVRLKA